MALLLLIWPAQGYEFDLVFQTKCMMEEVTAQSEITGSYQTVNRDNPGEEIPVNIKVRGLCTSPETDATPGAARLRQPRACGA